MFDAFKIGVSIVMENRASGAIGSIQRELGGLHRTVEDIHSSLRKMQNALGDVAAVLGGGGILDAMGQMVDKGKEQVNLEEQLLTAGVKRLEIARMLAEAQSLGLSKGDFSTTQYLEMMAEMRNSVPDTATVLQLAPAAADFMTDIKMGDPNGDTDGMLQDALKTIAIRGKLYKPGTHELDIPAITTELDWMGRETRFTHGQQNPHTMRQTAAQDGAAAIGMSPEAFYGWGAEVSNTMGASKAGTAMGSLFQQMVGGTMPKWIAENLINAKILHGDKVKFKSGHANLENGALDDQAGFTSNPFLWLSKEVSNYAKELHLSTAQAATQMFGRQTAQRLGLDSANNVGELSNAFDHEKQAWGVKQTSDEARLNSPDNIISQVTSAWTDLQAALSKSLWMPGGALTIWAHDLIDGIHTITAWVNDPKNAQLVEKIAMFAAVGVGIVTILGTVAVVGTALTFLGGGLVAVAPLFIGFMTFMGATLAGVAVFMSIFNALKSGTIRQLFQGWASDFRNGCAIIWAALTTGVVKNAFQAWVASFDNGLSIIWVALRPVGAQLWVSFKNGLDIIWGNIKSYFDVYVSKVSPAISTITGDFDRIISSITGFAGSLSRVVGEVASAGSSVGSWVESHADPRSLLPKWLGGTGAAPQGRSFAPPPAPSSQGVMQVHVVDGQVAVKNPGALARSTAQAMTNSMAGTNSGVPGFNRRQVQSTPAAGSL
jgi:hypothetical protein